MDKLRVIFMGTPEFAVPSLAALIDRTQVLCVVTQPDKPRGRGHKLQPLPVKVFAQENGLPVIQPPKVKAAEFVAHLAQLKPDLIVVVAFGQILSQELLDVPRFGCINVHASLLPKLRGAAPIEWSIIRGETVTGVTTMQMNTGLDTGDMLLASKVAIGADLLLKTLYLLQRGELHPVKQNDALSTYAPLIKRDTGLIDWTRPAREIHNLVRGLYGSARSGKLKIWRTRLTAKNLSLAVGEVKIVGQRLFVGTGDGALEVLELQAAGSKKLNAADFIRGRKVGDGFTANESLNIVQ